MRRLQRPHFVCGGKEHMAKKESTEWKQDAARAERKDRLAQMKGSDGQKKKIESRSIWKKVTLAAVAVVIVLAIAVWLIASTGILTRHSRAMTVNGRKVSAAEINIHIGNYTAAQQWGLAFSEQFQAEMDKKSQMDPNGTVRDDIANTIIPSVIYTAAMLEDMEKNDFKVTEEQQKEIDKTIENLDGQITQLALQSGTTLAGFLKSYFGPGVNMKLLKQDFVNSMKLQFYSEHIGEKADVSKEKIDTYYQEHKDTLDLFSYEIYVFKLDVKKDATADEKKEALAKLKTDAEAALKDLESNSFVEAVKKHVSKEDAEKLTKDPASVEKKNVGGQMLTGDIAKFLRDKDRKANDAKLIEEADSFALVRFLSRDRDASFQTYTVRHILFKQEADADEKAMEKLKQEAEKVLAEFKQGAKTEESFGELAKKHSKDPGSAEKGGLYADMAPDFQERLVPEFRDWFKASGRKAGDVEIIKTSHGYHIMYFVGRSTESALEKKITDTFKKDYAKEYGENVLKETTSERHSFGMKFVGQLHFFDALFSKAPKTPVTVESTAPPMNPN